MILLADSEDSDQTLRMRRLSWSLAVRICPNTRLHGAAHLCNRHLFGGLSISYLLSENVLFFVYVFFFLLLLLFLFVFFCFVLFHLFLFFFFLAY